MKTQAEKIISEKLSSLEELPAGYSPNIDAKWEIVRQGSTSKRNYKLWISIAACILLLIGTIFLGNYMTDPKSEIVNNAPLPMNHSFDKSEVNPFISPAAPQETKQSKRHTHKSIIPVEPEQQDIQPLEESPIAQAVQAENTIEKEAIQRPDEKSRQRYVEVDFDGPVQPLEPKGANTFASAFKFKLELGNQSAPDEHQDDKSKLRIRQNF